MPLRFTAALDSLALRAARIRMRWVLCALGAGALIQGYWVDIDPGRTEQGAFIAYAKALYDSGYSYIGDRSRMPLFPLLLSACGWMNADDWFYTGKAVAGVVAAAVACGMLAWLRSLFGRREGTVVWVALWGPALALRTFYVQADVLACGLALLAWGLVRGGDAGLARVCLAGLATGAAVMAKFSMLPFLAVVAGMLAASAGAGRRPLALARAAAYSAFALLPCWRYFEDSRARYGRWLYNVNSTFYFWYDSRSQVLAGTRAFGDREGWPRMPAASIPSLPWYLARHGVLDIAGRIAAGAAIQLGVLLLFCGLLLWVRPLSRLRRGMLRSPRDWAILALGTVYFALTSWWMPLGIGSRYMLPIVLICLVEAWARVRGPGEPERLYGSAALWILAVWPFLALFSVGGE